MTTVATDNVQVDVHHVTRVEGHGNIVVNVRQGIIEQCDLQIVETPRFFESMLRGQPCAQAPYLTARICGICSVGHATTSLCAIEKALGVEVSEQTRLLRKLNLYAEILDSHILHTYMLVAPDLLGAGSVISLAKSTPDLVLRALRMKKLAGDVCATVGGRHTHPIAMAIGGFTHFPTNDELRALCGRLEAMHADVDATVESFQEFPIPDLERETEYIALHNDNEYCFMDGVISSSDGGIWPVEEYHGVTNEYQTTHSSAKHARNQRQSYMVGALARFNLHHDKLHPRTQSAARALGLTAPCINPYMNTIAQVVEIAHCLKEMIQIVQSLLERVVTSEIPVTPTCDSGEGVGACEVPRGTLYHHYTIRNGLIIGANCVIPTSQNLANIELDMRALVSRMLNRTPEEITQALEMLVRAYDPCISCAAHMLEVRYV